MDSQRLWCHVISNKYSYYGIDSKIPLTTKGHNCLTKLKKYLDMVDIDIITKFTDDIITTVKWYTDSEENNYKKYYKVQI